MNATTVSSHQITLKISFSQDRGQTFEFPQNTLLTLPRVGDQVFTPENEEGESTGETVADVAHTFVVEEDGSLSHTIEVKTEQFWEEDERRIRDSMNESNAII